ncbi:modular protein with glycoside hydrolase family 13 and glycosyltransferase family 5 domains [Lentinula aciculospora]|uniref:alpha-1,3-glucan synthase n=1 Tax=Lentinula aciculospora TaxID=153920 RepID=A0A9W9A6T9_9AGAR|nr:modular protein with glycoside hydrolase family 13 and glycosyltransferase family 5 domains [Lentinula aciculospora]
MALAIKLLALSLQFSLYHVFTFVNASPYNEQLTQYNLNINKTATSPLDYYTNRTNTSYTPSPSNWRSLPIYTVLLDKFANGEPSNDDFFKTPYESDWRETQLRFGGDLKGLSDDRMLDYLQGMGVGVIYIAGTIFLNEIWEADGYSPLDFSVLDPHWGTWNDWVQTIDAVHARGMYIMLDFTVGTMSDLIGFKGFLNTTAPFSLSEYDAEYLKPGYIPWNFTDYKDFQISNTRNTSCVLPQFWNDDGTLIVNITANGCLESDFDHYGSIEAFGVFPDWQRQLSKFAGVQDRLREWKPGMIDKLKMFSCMVIQALDIDAIRVDKSLQVTLEALAEWSQATRACAVGVGKENFYIAGEVTGGDTFGALYLGRGRTPSMRPDSISTAANLTSSDTQYFLRPEGFNALDGCAFHYSIYRSLTSFLGMDGNLQDAYDLSSDSFITAWNEMFVNDDFINPNTGVVDPRHMFGTSNFDVFRWPSLSDGARRGMLGAFVTGLLMPGLVMYYYGEEQDFYAFDSTANNYLYGRQAMPSSRAWLRHGCYQLGSQQYFNMPLSRSLLGCDDSSMSLDHFDPTASTRLLFTQFNFLRSTYSALQDGFTLTQLGNWTYEIQRPGSGGVSTEMGLWSIAREGMQNVQVLNGTHNGAVWMFMTNENVTKSYEFNCSSSPDWIKSPYPVESGNSTGASVRNLLYPFENYTLQPSLSPYFNDGNAPYFGCLEGVTMDAYGYKVLVLNSDWVEAPPALTLFTPGHDARILSSSSNGTENVDVSLGFNSDMDCDTVTNSISLSMSSSGHGSPPSIGNVSCLSISPSDSTGLAGVPQTAWVWNATLTNLPDGLLTIAVDSPSSAGGVGTGATDHLILRKGQSGNVMIFPNNDYNNSALVSTNNEYMYTHSAFGADQFRYSLDFGQTWTNWTQWEDVTTVNQSFFADSSIFWNGVHLMVQYWSQVTMTTENVIHADSGGYTGPPRRVPQFLGRGNFNEWGNNQGVNSQFTLRSDNSSSSSSMSSGDSGNLWELKIMAAWPTFIELNVWGFGVADYYYGDTDDDGVLDRLPPNTEAPNYVNMSAPPYPYLSWSILVDDSTMRWTLQPRGRAMISMVVYSLLVSVPLITGTLAVLIFMIVFYGVEHNKYGVGLKSKYLPIFRHQKKPISADLNSELALVDSKLAHTAVQKSKHSGRHPIIGWPEDPQKLRRTALIATLEYEIVDWNLKVKIGGLGVMSSLMGKAMTDVDLIWVVPKVKDLEYPAGDPDEPMEVVIFGETYLVDVEIHVAGHIIYVILDSPVFRAQTKADPYPSRMDDLSSAIFYSTWNQAIAATIRRYPQIDIYHINDYHGALAPIYLLPKVIPVCLSLHNAEFQGLWPLRTKEEMKEVCSAFNISKKDCVKYIQFGNTFNLLHAAAEFVSLHQKSVGVAGVSDKYGKRSWARYPALWTLKHVDSLPNPDPTDIAALEEKPVKTKGVKVDKAAEKARPELKRQAQEWAGIEQKPNSNLFVFVGRWSKQKGVDLIADVMPGLLEKDDSVQLITVGPVIDLYGRLAAEKLSRLMEMYPGRVYSKPEFTALPPYLFSGADFALIPSRDEPFGLVAVEFGRKGALGVGSRLGGLGLMPGWWFPVESSSTSHMLSQLTKTIKMALKSTDEERAFLRARSAIQRFPVVEWRQRIEDFHRRSITISREVARENAWRPDDGYALYEGVNEPNEWDPEVEYYHSRPRSGISSHNSSARASMEALTPITNTNEPIALYAHSDSVQDSESNRDSYVSDDLHAALDGVSETNHPTDYENFLERVNRIVARDRRRVPDPFLEGSSGRIRLGGHSRTESSESISTIVETKSDSPLNKAIASFTDADGGVTAAFITRLEKLNAKNSEHGLSIEKYLMKSEEAFFDKVRRKRLSSASASIKSKRSSFWGSSDSLSASSLPSTPGEHIPFAEEPVALQKAPPEFPMNRLQIALSREIKGWPLYTLIIALGQMLSATSFQMTLLTGRNWQSNTQLYIIGSIFLVASLVWYPLCRLKPTRYSLSLPWIFFGIAFFLIGLPSVSSSLHGVHTILSNIATWFYAAASAAGFLFFALNFGEEAGAATEIWVLRACIVQGSQQIWVAALWYWGYTLNNESASYIPPWWLTVIVWTLSFMSFLFGFMLYHGLPEYYRQTPPKVSHFLTTLFRRKLVIWFLISEVLRDYWLSGPYGLNWTYLWNVNMPKLHIFILILAFFVGVWAVMLAVLSHFSKTHTWLLPVFAVGLGAPRWCQMLWGTSSLATYVPWGGNAGPYLSVGLWLWLGVLDAVQGVGLGMILLQTLSRLHVTATLAFSQIIGSAVVMIARATSPDGVGPGPVFPNLGTWDPVTDGLKGSPIVEPMFWVALGCQLIIVAGYFWFYRREELARP